MTQVLEVHTIGLGNVVGDVGQQGNFQGTQTTLTTWSVDPESEGPIQKVRYNRLTPKKQQQQQQQQQQNKWNNNNKSSVNLVLAWAVSQHTDTQKEHQNYIKMLFCAA